MGFVEQFLWASWRKEAGETPIAKFFTLMTVRALGMQSNSPVSV